MDNHADRLIKHRKELRTRRGRPCPVCEKTDGWCLADEAAALCPRVKGQHRFGEYGWLHVLSGALPVYTPVKSERRKSDAELHAIWAPRARALWRHQSEPVARLAKMLGVAAWALDQLRVGYGEYGRRLAWWFPERNHTGLIVGLNGRDVDGKKRCAVGSRRGLTYTDNWLDYPGPVVIVEGGSDVAALLTLGLCAVGRPSNTGGAVYLVPLLRPVDRKLVVLIERDRKEHGQLSADAQARHAPACRQCALCWPGYYGAMQVADTLTRRLHRPVQRIVCPNDAKDPRAWLQQHRLDPDNQAWCGELRKRFLRAIGWRGLCD